MNHAFLTRLGTRSLVGFLCIWIVIMTFGQKGVIGGIRVTLLLIVVAFAAKTLPGARLRQIAKSTTVPAILAFWIGLAGTYSLTRDLIMIVFSTTLVIMLFEVTRGAFLARHNLPRRFIRGDVGFQLTWLFLAWLLISVGDLTFEKGVIERNGNVVSPTAILPEWRDLHVGVALSGGGYRAA